jgi:hypothetical protein
MNPEYKVRELREARAAKQAEMEQMQREQMQADMAAKVGPVLQRPVEEGSIGQAMMNAGGMEAAPVQ